MAVDVTFLPPGWKQGDPPPDQPQSPSVTIEQSQSTPVSDDQYVAQDIQEGANYVTQAPTSSGVGAGTSSNSYNARGNDNTPPVSSNTNQQVISQSFANQPVIAQPNVLDQYASYTYGISWYVLTPEQFNQMTTPNFSTGQWSLLMQSGGASIKQRNQFFPDDYYLDDLEIETFLMGKGTNMSTNAMDLRFKVVEPNGITLIQNLYKAVVGAYQQSSKSEVTAATNTAGAFAAQGTAGAANQTNDIPNYGAAQYCLTIEFYGYDSNGTLVTPARGQYTTNGQFGNTSSQAIVRKYYPFIIQNLTFRTVANAIEYTVVGAPIPYDTGASQSRGTIPFAFALAGQTVSQILQGGPPSATATNKDQGARVDKSEPSGGTEDWVPPATTEAGYGFNTDTNTFGDGSLDTNDTIVAP